MDEELLGVIQADTYISIYLMGEKLFFFLNLFFFFFFNKTSEKSILLLIKKKKKTEQCSSVLGHGFSSSDAWHGTHINRESVTQTSPPPATTRYPPPFPLVIK